MITTSEAKPETVQIQFALEWLKEWDRRAGAPDEVFPVAAPGGAPQAGRLLRCARCSGNLIRSHVRLYERWVTVFVRVKPYRCTDCKKRRWR